MPEKIREFQIFTKPVGSVCNLRCSYCYYLDKKDLYPETRHFLMDDSTLEKYIIQHIEASTEPVISFSWHGGEPLLAGIEFYRKALSLQHIHKPSDKVIVNGIQTNGTLIDEEWSRFFAENAFIVGISIDGPPEFHNISRRTKDGSPSFQSVRNGFDLLLKHSVVPEVLCVVNSENVKQPVVIYNFCKQLGARYITFLPLVKAESGSVTGVSKESVPAEAFGYFLGQVFDLWAENDIGTIKIQIFEEAARVAFNQDHTLCIFKETCGGVPVVEFNGDFYSCDHYVDSGHILGNISDHSLAFYFDSTRQRAFGMAKLLTLPQYCLECEVRKMCNGECPKNRFILTPEGEAGLNYLCKGYKYFFNHCRPFVDTIAEMWRLSQPSGKI
jgi:uncharacterized protein